MSDSFQIVSVRPPAFGGDDESKHRRGPADRMYQALTQGLDERGIQLLAQSQ
jgi:hypothetical protein